MDDCDRSHLRSHELDDAVAIFEHRFKVYQGSLSGIGPLSPTGEEYVEIFVGGDPMFKTEAGAIATWMEKLSKYAEGKSGTLYWRIPPERDKFAYYLAADQAAGLGIDALWIWKVYARLLISDKPIVALGGSALWQ